MSTELRALVVYESMFGNTERLAVAIADGLRLDGATVALAEVNQAPSVIPSNIDLLVVGAPTHALALSRPATRADAVQQGAPHDRAALGIREWLSATSAHSGLGIAVFDTRASKVRRLPLAAGPSAAKIARNRGLTLLSKPVGFAVDDVKGPLAEDELERAAQWGRYLAGVARIHLAAEHARNHITR